MGDKTKIEWTDATWNPIRAKNRATGEIGWFCIHVSDGCKGCYSESMNLRLGTKLPFKPGHLKSHRLFLDPDMLTQPMRWRKRRKIFVCSMTDLFADFVSDDMIDQVFAIMALSPQHTFQVLTKRPDRMRSYLENAFDRMVIAMMGFTDAGWPTARETGDRHGLPWHQPRSAHDWWPLRNVWLGTSVEDQANADARIPQLMATLAAIRFLSCEPLLGPLDLTPWLKQIRKPDWVICGGESGRIARPMHPSWARSLRDQCAFFATPFHFKQWGEWAPGEVAADHLDPEKSYNGRSYINGRWVVQGSTPEDHVDDEPDVYRVGKGAAGRKLDGVEHDGFPV